MNATMRIQLAVGSRMKTIISTVSLSLFMAAPLLATQPPDLQQLLQRHAQAVGGSDLWQSVESMRLEGQIETNGASAGNFVILKKRPHKIRREYHSGVRGGIQAFDGEKAWAIFGEGGAVRLLDEDAAARMRRQAEIVDPLLELDSEGLTAELAGQVEIDGDRQAYKITVSEGGFSVRHVFLDTESYLTIKIEEERTIGEDTVRTETVFADYRTVEGLEIPYLITSSLQGKQQSGSMRIKAVLVNVPAPDDLFSPPE